VPGLAWTAAAGLARRITGAQWTAVEAGLVAVTDPRRERGRGAGVYGSAE
jgi:hypothetical protein